MFNAKIPDIKDLPTSKQLLKSTCVALFVAALLLITTILPAEYGIDPTGIGRLVGLNKMGEIKTSLKSENSSSTSTTSSGVVTKSDVAETHAPVNTAELVREDSVMVTLDSGQAAEIKLSMLKDQSVKYKWFTEGGPVNHDTHGDPLNPPKGFYHGYSKGRMVDIDEGVLIAAFDGKHGWFWRNRTDKKVTVTLKTRGTYSNLLRVF
jgi:hypothetical protein